MNAESWKANRHALGRAIAVVQASCGGQLELAMLLHVTPNTIANWRNGKHAPGEFACLQLARICRTLDGPASIRTVEYWLELAGHLTAPETGATSSPAAGPEEGRP